MYRGAVTNPSEREGAFLMVSQRQTGLSRLHTHFGSRRDSSIQMHPQTEPQFMKFRWELLKKEPMKIHHGHRVTIYFLVPQLGPEWSQPCVILFLVFGQVLLLDSHA